MYKGYRVVTVTPAGRERYMRILSGMLLNNRFLIDRHEWWMNTESAEDIAYMKSLSLIHPDFFSVVECPTGFLKEANLGFRIHQWYPARGCDRGTIYIRLDDDIVWMDKDAIERLLEYRLHNQHAFLVYPNIINNSYISALHQRMGMIPDWAANTDMSCFGMSWFSAEWGEMAHREFIKAYQHDGAKAWRFNEWKLMEFNRVSVNVICWFGRDFFKFGGHVGSDEEQWLSVEQPRRLNRPNAICGQSLMVHFAYYPQRGALDDSGLLEQYKKL